MNKRIWMAVIGLTILVAVTAFLNRGDLAFKKEMQDNAIISVKSGDEQVLLDLKKILKLKVEDFTATLKSNGKEPRQVVYRGVALQEILQTSGVELADKSQVIVRAVDGYTVALSVHEVMDTENVYLVFQRDGAPLGKKEEGGAGPYQVVIRKDAFSQRWCKFVTEVEVR